MHCRDNLGFGYHMAATSCDSFKNEGEIYCHSVVSNAFKNLGMYQLQVRKGINAFIFLVITKSIYLHQIKEEYCNQSSSVTCMTCTAHLSKGQKSNITL